MANFTSVIDTFRSFDVRHRGYLQFMETALKNMKRFGVEKDVEAYNLILDIFPKGPFIPTNFFQAIMNHAPEQQSMGMKILQQMEDNCKVLLRKEILISCLWRFLDREPLIVGQLST